MTRAPVVVVGLDCPTGLQTARVFAARGIEVIGVATNPRHPCVRTRRCGRVIRAEAGPDGVVDALLALGEGLDERAVLIPCTDHAVVGIARRRRELAVHFLIAVPGPEVIDTLMNKASFVAFAERHDIPMPPTRVVRHRGEVERAADELRFPCVLKPSVKSVTWDAGVGVKAFVVGTRAELIDTYNEHAHRAEAFVVQEWVRGGDTDHYTCDSYLKADGEPLVTFSSRKLRQWPPIVGQACLSVEHRNDAVRDEALRIFRLAGHHGQGYVEMKWDASTGRHVVIEANVGRPTGRSAAAEKAGVELLMTLYCDLVGESLPTERTQLFRGSKWIHVRHDLQACSQLLWNRRIGVREVFRSWRGRFAFALFSVRDPVPFAADLAQAAGRVVKAPFGRRRGSADTLVDPGEASLA